MDQVTICNLALAHIGTRSSISSMDEGSTESITCSLHYQPALEAALSSSRWNFARKQIILALLNDATQGQTVPTPWMYEYVYPADCVQARYIMPSFESSPSVSYTPATPEYAGPPVKYLISSDTDANQNPVTVILTNQPQAILVYTARITNPNNFDGKFVQALAFMLASHLAIPLTGDKVLARTMFELAGQAAVDAEANNGNEGLTVIEYVPESIRVRGYASDYAYPDGGLYSYGPQALNRIN